MSRSDGRSRILPLHRHPFFFPTVFVVGGWALLIGGYLPGQEDRPAERGGPSCCVHHPHCLGHAAAAQAIAAPPPPPPEPIDYRVAADRPVRLTIEFPGGHGATPTVVVDGRPPASEAPRAEDVVIPPAIPGPPPGFVPSGYSSAIPLTMSPRPVGVPGPGPSAPIAAAAPGPMAELPESFDPASILGISRMLEGDDPDAIGIEDAVPASAATAGSDSPAADDRAPEPPSLPLPDPNPDASPGAFGAVPGPGPAAPQPIAPRAQGLGEASGSAPGGVRGFFGRFRPREAGHPSLPVASAVEGEVIAEAMAPLAEGAGRPSRSASPLPPPAGYSGPALPTEEEMARLAADLVDPGPVVGPVSAAPTPPGPELPLPDPRLVRAPVRELVEERSSPPSPAPFSGDEAVSRAGGGAP